MFGLSLVTNNLVKRHAGFVEARLLAPLQLLPSMVVLRNLSQSRSRSLIAMFSIQPHMYVHLIRSTSKKSHVAHKPLHHPQTLENIFFVILSFCLQLSDKCCSLNKILNCQDSPMNFVSLFSDHSI